MKMEKFSILTIKKIKLNGEYIDMWEVKRSILMEYYIQKLTIMENLV